MIEKLAWKGIEDLPDYQVEEKINQLVDEVNALRKGLDQLGRVVEAQGDILTNAPETVPGDDPPQECGFGCRPLEPGGAVFQECPIHRFTGKFPPSASEEGHTHYWQEAPAQWIIEQDMGVIAMDNDISLCPCKAILIEPKKEA